VENLKYFELLIKYKYNAALVTNTTGETQEINIVKWLAKALLGNDTVNTLQRKQQ
jgi:hypothetical protein